MNLSAVDLNGPGTYVHWGILQVSLANLLLIGAMDVIFGVALLLPFPKDRKTAPVTASPEMHSEPSEPEDPETAKMWTAAVRRRALSLLPPGK